MVSLGPRGIFLSQLALQGVVYLLTRMRLNRYNRPSGHESGNTSYGVALSEMNPHSRHKFYRAGCIECLALVAQTATTVSPSKPTQQQAHSVHVAQKLFDPGCPSCIWPAVAAVPGWLPQNGLILNPTAPSVPTVTLTPVQRETVTAVRVLSQHMDCWLYGSVTNLWLDGTPKDETVAMFYQDNTKTLRDLNVGCPANKVNGLVNLLSSTVVRPLKVGKVGNLLAVKVNDNLLVRFQVAASPWDTLVQPNADITANMKYVQQEQLIEVLPDAIEDARLGRLVWLDTVPYQRRYVIETKMDRSSLALYRGFYGVCVAYSPPPPPVEKYTGVVTGWRTYSWAVVQHRVGTYYARPVPMLAGDKGHVWDSGVYKGSCDVGGNMADPKHLEGCGCGVYMQKEPRTYRENVAVYAQCVAGGLVAMHTHGYRASIVRIEKLYVLDSETPENWMRALGALYDCEVTKPVMRLGSWGSYEQDLMNFLGVERMFDDRLH